jgi:hypothetical protein
LSEAPASRLQMNNGTSRTLNEIRFGIPREARGVNTAGCCPKENLGVIQTLHVTMLKAPTLKFTWPGVGTRVDDGRGAKAESEITGPGARHSGA